MLRKISIASAALNLVLVSWIVYKDIHERVQLGKQISTHMLCQTYSTFLENYNEAEGHYPASLDMAVPADRPDLLPAFDAWGRPLRYLSDGDGFILASLGSDGEADFSKLITLSVARWDPLETDICESYPSDEVVSHRGFHTLCGK